jgi:hypothetical protein
VSEVLLGCTLIKLATFAIISTGKSTFREFFHNFLIAVNAQDGGDAHTYRTPTVKPKKISLEDFSSLCPLSQNEREREEMSAS